MAAIGADSELAGLCACIENGFPRAVGTANDTLSQFWKYKYELLVVEGTILYCDRVVVPPSLRREALMALQAAHQGVSGLLSSARQLVFWPGTAADINRTQEGCQESKRNAPSEAPPPPSNVCPVAATPFEAIFADFFEHPGHNYVVVEDRLSS